MRELTRDERLRLLRFVCSFAWSDLQVVDEERALVEDFLDHYGLEADEEAMVRGWLDVPPPAEELDPMAIPREHRELFLEAVRAMIVSDGKVAPVERDGLRILTELLDA